MTTPLHPPHSPACDHAATIAADRLAGVATPDAVAQLEAHLAVCSLCRAALAGLEQAEAAVASLVIPREHAEAHTTGLPFPGHIPVVRSTISGGISRAVTIAAAIALAFVAGWLVNASTHQPPSLAARDMTSGNGLAAAAARIARERPDAPPMAWGLLSIARR